jgi:acyl-CoA thioester hydrolase
MADLFTHPVDVRYLEVDAQGVVFNMWYLAYFDDAMTAFLEHGGLRYEDMLAAGFDAQLVHASLDWRGGVGFRDDVRVAVSLARVGRTSFTLDFQVLKGGSGVVDGRVVYVVVAAHGGGKVAIPPLVRDALGEERPLRPLP